MFPVIHGILAQTQEGESCVYPLDATPEQWALIDAAAFNLNDECGHSLSISDYSGNQPVAAMSKEAFDAIMSGAEEIPAEQLFPPSSHRYVALDFRLKLAAQEVGSSGGNRPFYAELRVLDLTVPENFALMAAYYTYNQRIELILRDAYEDTTLHSGDLNETLDVLVSVLFDTQERRHKVFINETESDWGNYVGQGFLSCTAETDGRFSITADFELE